MLHTTTGYGIPYCDSDTALGDLAGITETMAETIDSVLLTRDVPPAGGFTDWIARFAVSVRTRGAAGNGTTDDSAAFASALAGGNVTVYVPPGSYRITAPLRIQANTWLLMHPAAVVLNDLAAQTPYVSEAVFTNGVVGNTAYASGYTGDGNIRVTGGTVDCAPRRARTTLAECFAFAHAENIIVEGVQMLHGYSSHFLELNSVRHAVVRDCTFSDLDAAGGANRECINIDSATQGGFPHFGGWDATVCEDVLIENCRFADCQDGIGTHAAPAVSAHRGVRIVGCSFVNLSGVPVHGRGWVGGIVEGCRVLGCATNAVYLDTVQSFGVVRNYLSGAGRGQNARDAVVYFSVCDNCFADENRIGTTEANVYRTPYQVAGASANCRIRTGGATLGTSGKIVESDAPALQIDGGWRLALPTDAAASVPLNGTELQGLVLVGGHSTQAYMPRGLYWARGDSTPSVVAIARSAGETTTLTTGVLTGTTTTAGGMALSAANNGRLYVENRSGSARNVSIQLVTA